MSKSVEDFKQWAEERGFSSKLRLDPNSDDTFFAYETEQRWLVWQGAQFALSIQQEADAKDAARYRFLRYGDNDELVLRFYAGAKEHPAGGASMFLPRTDKLDYAIDTAMATPTDLEDKTSAV